MGLSIYLSKVSSEYNSLLSGLDVSLEWALWVEPTTTFGEDDIDKMCKAFAEYRGIVWKINMGGKKATKFGKAVGKRVFKPDLSLSKNVVSENTIVYKLNIDKPFFFDQIFVDTAWITPESYEEIVEISLGSTFGKHSVIAFLPDAENSAWQWSNVAYGIACIQLWRMSFSITPALIPAIESTFLNYIKLTSELNGIAGVVYSDMNEEYGLVFFGSEAVLTLAYGRLTLTETELAVKDISDFIKKRGIYLRYM